MRVPYITTWSSEAERPGLLIESHALGIAYADETLLDRDEHGILWRRMPSRPGGGRPLFGRVHSLRQRRAMRRLLCQVCAGPADRTEHGTLWLVPDFDDNWPNWPEGMAATEPPICISCAQESIQLCPTLRKRHAIFRVRHSPVSGVYGVRYRPGKVFPELIDDVIVAFDDPAIRWVCAGQLVRELFDCIAVDPDEIAALGGTQRRPGVGSVMP